MSPKSTVKVQVLRRLDASAERVFDAFLDPKLAGRFMFATANGKIIRAEVDPRVGGSFVFVDRRPNGDAEHYGTFVELDRPKRLSFRFAVQKDAAETDLVVIALSPKMNRCEVSLTHEIDARFESVKDRVAEGWTSILAGLAAVLEHQTN